MESKNDTANLVARARQGDRAAFDELVVRTRSPLRATIEARLGQQLRNKAEVEDVLQETYARAFAAIAAFEDRRPESFLPWLRAIAQNIILELAKKHRRDPVLGIEREPHADDASPSQHLRRKERFERLRDALSGLSDDHREVVYLARIEGLKIREIAERMGRSPGAIGNLLLRAMKELKKSLAHTESLSLPDESLKRESRGPDAPRA